jgi:hypothetical protein
MEEGGGAGEEREATKILREKRALLTPLKTPFYNFSKPM